MKKFSISVFIVMSIFLSVSQSSFGQSKLEKTILEAKENPYIWGVVMGCAIRLQYLASEIPDYRSEELQWLLGDKNGFKILDKIIPLVAMPNPLGMKPEEYREFVIDMAKVDQSEGAAWINASNCILWFALNGILEFDNVNQIPDGVFLPKAK